MESIRKIFAFCLFLSFLLFFAFPSQKAEAAGWIECNPSIPIPQPGSCDLCALLKTVQQGIIRIIELVFVIATGIIIYNGVLFYFSQGSLDKVTAILRNIRNVVIGIVIVMASWIIVNTIINTFAGSESPLRFWNVIECQSSEGEVCTQCHEVPKIP